MSTPRGTTTRGAGGKVAVMGAGSWGTAYAMMCADAGEDVLLWARRQEVADQVSTTHRNPDYLGDIDLGPGLRATSDAEEALTGAEVVVLAVPSHALRASLTNWVDLVPRDGIFVSLIKGIELDTRQRASQVVREVLDAPYSHVVVVSGPNLARECARRLPGGTVVAGPESRITKRVQAMCHTAYFRVYTNPDVIGVELGGAVKNGIALAAGMADGLGIAHGGNPLTFSGLAGMGDLVATCMSRQSRNRHVGEQLGRGRSLEEVIAEMNMVAEGVRSSKAMLALAAEHGVEMPIIEHVVRVVHEGMDPKAMVQSLMGRDPKAEFHGLDGVGLDGMVHH